MKRTLLLLVGLLSAGPAFAESARSDPLDLTTGGAVRDDPVRDENVVRDARLGAGAAGVVEGVLEQLGVDKDRLAEELADDGIRSAADNWRDEQSGEVGLSFDLTDKLSVGPSVGLRWEQEHSGAFREEWSQQLKLGARYTF